jgi:hypothetical protein
LKNYRSYQRTLLNVVKFYCRSSTQPCIHSHRHFISHFGRHFLFPFRRHFIFHRSLGLKMFSIRLNLIFAFKSISLARSPMRYLASQFLLGHLAFNMIVSVIHLEFHSFDYHGHSAAAGALPRHCAAPGLSEAAAKYE